MKKKLLMNKVYVILAIGVLLLLSSFFISYHSVTNNAKMLKYFDREQIKLTFYIRQLNNALYRNHFVSVQALLVKENNSSLQINNSFKNIELYIQKLKIFSQKTALSQDLLLDKIKNIEKSYTIYKNNSDNLVLLNNSFETILQNIELLINFANAEVYQDLFMLEHNNTKNTQSIILSFILALIIIVYIIIKFVFLHKKIQEQLERAQMAEKNLIQTQEQLLKYNDDLETQVSQKTQELHAKIYNHFISGLPNRNRLLEDIISYDFAYLALLNLDKFQSFNDVYGEETGNIAITLTANFLLEQVYEPELYLYHIGGDEFALVCRDSAIISRANFIQKTESILNHYKDTEFVYEDKKFSFLMSAGIAFNGKEKKMLAYADMALKDAKKRNVQISLFDDGNDLEKVHQEDIDCHKRLLFALENSGIVSYFQPIVPLQDTTKPIKYESLVRLVHNDEVIAPFHFLRVAKNNRIYDKITHQVIQNTFSVIQKHKIPCSLNLSLADIEDERTMENLFYRIERFDYNHLLTIELLETEDFQNYDDVYNFCVKVRSFGITVALDDFGAGYTNFSHILNLPVNFIKIDASLISNIERDYNSQIMVETIVALAKRLKVETIAEFVSSEGILNIVQKIGVDYAQGYHLGKPEPIEKHLKS